MIALTFLTNLLLTKTGYSSKVGENVQAIFIKLEPVIEP